ncbi:HNH endonuclease [Frigidibacter sp. MR17.24]|uniref:HNH endonuclease n=1 Tax=Frigidibacter sp. MR17.24 TaxID=3127345 RepID=UPI003012B2C1
MGTKPAGPGPSLSAKQQLHAKVGALALIAKHVGLIQVTRATPAKAKDLTQLERGMAVAAAMVVCDADQPPINRAACGFILDILFPGWRRNAPLEVKGLLAERDDHAVRQWREAVLYRDGLTCTKCGADEDLEAHHLARWADFPELRLDLDNGTTLCKACHIEEHHPGHLEKQSR